jgi:hypothetical protein
MDFNVKGPCFISGKCSAVLRKLLISCRLLELQGGAKVIKSIIVFKLSKKPAPSAITLLV